MKKFLLLIGALTIVLSLSACDLFGGGGDIDVPGLTKITIGGITAEVEIEEGDAFNALTGITAMGDDDIDYSALVTADSETCSIDSDGNVDTSSAMICIINYTVVAAGKLARGSMTLTIKPEQIDIGGDLPLVAGWTFDDVSELDGWNIYVANSGSIVKSLEDGAMKLVTTSGANRYETRLDYQGLPLELNEAYKFSFRMKSDVDGKKVHINFGELLPAAPYFTPFKAENIDIITLTTEWQTFEFTFLMELDNQNGGPLFEMGDLDGSAGIDATIWVDDIKVEGGSGTDLAGPALTGAQDLLIEVNSTFDPLAGVTAMDFVDGDLTSSIVVTGDTVDTSTAGTYDVTYTVTDAAGNETTLTITITVVALVVDTNNAGVNDIFASDTTITDDETAEWYTTITWGEPIFTAEIVSGQLVLTNAKDGEKDYGTDFWNHIVRYAGLALIKDVEYKIDFDAMTDEVGNTTDNMMIKVETADGFFVEEAKVVTDTMGTYSLAFTYTGETTSEGYLLFFVGGREHVITIEDIVVYIAAEAAGVDNDPILTVPEDVSINPGDVVDLDAATASDIEDGELTPTYTVLGPNDETVFDSAVGGEWVITYSVTDSGGNTVTADFVITVETLVWDPTDLMMNGTFDGPWNPFYAGWTSATALYTINEAGELEITIGDVGPDNWSVLVEQGNLTLEVGKSYRITFDAKADAARTIQANLVYGGADHNVDIVLTDTMATYTADYVFDGDAEVTDAFVKLMMGNIADAAAGVVTIDNVMLEEFDGTAVVADTDQILAGGFDDFVTDGWSSWSKDWDPVVTSSFNVEYNEAVFKYDGVGEASYHNQLNYEGIAFEVGKTYRVTFDAKGDAARQFDVTIYDGATDWRSDPLDLGTEFATYSHVFTYDGAATAKISFELGVVGTTGTDFGPGVFYLDNVVIEELYEPQYLATDFAFNGTFDAAWNPFYAGWTTASALYAINEAGELEVTITDVGPDNWSVLVETVQQTLVVGKSYRLTFDAKADVARTIQANLWWSDTDHNVDVLLTDAMATYTVDFVYDGTEDNDAAMIKFLMGNIAGAGPGVVTLDNVMFEEFDGTAVVADTDQVVDGGFDAWVSLGWSSWSRDWEPIITSSFNVEYNEGVFRYDGVGSDGWNNQLNVEGLTFEVGRTYRITFDAKGDAARQFDVTLYDGTTDIRSEAFDLGTEFATYTYEFVYTNEPVSKISFELGTVGTTTSDFGAGIFYLDNVVVEVLEVTEEAPSE